MNKIFYIVLIILLIGLIPIIPYEKEIQHGVITVDNISIANWTYERYKTVQAQNEIKSDEQAPVAQ